MINSVPKWLKAMQNGSIGEARARAFLLNRFWVLERSVDIDGADLIIQRRLTQQNLLDKTPPRLGVVQVKFFNSKSTTQYIHQEYIKNAEGILRTEFFLLCHTGNEEKAETYLLTSQDIDNNFEIVDPGSTHSGKYRIGGSKLLGNDQYQVVNKKNTLDRIEHALELADFSKNRRFMSWLLPSAQLEEAAIETIYREPLDNYWGDIPTGFLGMKKKARKAMFDLEDIHEKLKGIVESTDPIKAFELVEDIEHECKSGYGWNVSLPEDLLDEDFQMVVCNHKNMVTVLKENRLLDSFLSFRNIIREKVVEKLNPSMPLSRDKSHIVTVTYNSKTLSDVKITSTIDDSPTSDSHDTHTNQGILESQKGFFSFYWTPGVYSLDEDDKINPEGWDSYIRNIFWSPLGMVMDRLYEINFGDS